MSRKPWTPEPCDIMGTALRLAASEGCTQYSEHVTDAPGFYGRRREVFSVTFFRGASVIPGCLHEVAVWQPNMGSFMTTGRPFSRSFIGQAYGPLKDIPAEYFEIKNQEETQK